MVGGIIPETFTVIRALLDKIDDPTTGEVHSDFQSLIPEWKVKEAETLALT